VQNKSSLQNCSPVLQKDEGSKPILYLGNVMLWGIVLHLLLFPFVSKRHVMVVIISFLVAG
jgi:hypothetical protein